MTWRSEEAETQYSTPALKAYLTYLRGVSSDLLMVHVFTHYAPLLTHGHLVGSLAR